MHWEFDAFFNKQNLFTLVFLRGKNCLDEAMLPHKIRPMTSKRQGGDDVCVSDAPFPARVVSCAVALQLPQTNNELLLSRDGRPLSFVQR